MTQGIALPAQQVELARCGGGGGPRVGAQGQRLLFQRWGCCSTAAPFSSSELAFGFGC